MSFSKDKSSHGFPTVADSVTDTFLKRYRMMEKIGEGSYSEVVKCKNREKGDIVACKRLKHVYRNWSQVNEISEVTTLRSLARHPNILQMIEIHFDQSVGKVSLVFELMEMNLYELIKDRKRMVPEKRVRYFMFQLMKALRHLHKHGIFHRDIKPENILLRPKTDLLKLGDLGSVRGVYSRPPYTEYISTRWYRSPECLLTAGFYTFKMDIWAAGCVFYEILTLRPLFPGSSELDQINRIHNIMGPPPQKLLLKFSKHCEEDAKKYYQSKSQQARLDIINDRLNDMKAKSESPEWKSKNFELYFSGKEGGSLERSLPPHISIEARELLGIMLSYDPEFRPTAHRILQHEYLTECRENQIVEKEQKGFPHIEIFGDPKGKALLTQNLQYVNLRTLGDKKHQKRRREVHYTNLHKKPDGKPVPKKSSPILRGAGSPGTPQSQLSKGMDIRKPLNPLKMSGIDVLKRKYAEKEEVQKEVVEKRSVTKVRKQSRDEEGEQEASRKRSSSTPPEKRKLGIPDTLAAKKRQVLAGNLAPSLFQSMEQTIQNQPSQVPSQQPRPIDMDTSSSLSKKVINHKLTSDDLKKINERRHLVQMDPIGKPDARKLIKESPYIKPPTELSLAGRKKVLLQQQQQQQQQNLRRTRNSSPNAYQKRLERLKTDSSTMHVPPQVAAAALKLSSQDAAAALKQATHQGPSSLKPPINPLKNLQPKEPLPELTTKKRSILTEKQPTVKPINATVQPDYQLPNTRSGNTSRLLEKTNNDGFTKHEDKLQSLMDRMDNKEKTGESNALPKTERSKYPIENIKRKVNPNNVTNAGLAPLSKPKNTYTSLDAIASRAGISNNVTVTNKDKNNNKNDNFVSPMSKEMFPSLAAVADRNATITNNNMTSIYETLDLDKQDRLSVRQKEEYKMRPVLDVSSSKISPYTKYLASSNERSKETEKIEKDITKFSNISNLTRSNKLSAASNMLFPRNRFGLSEGGAVNSCSNRNPIVSNNLEGKYYQIAKVYPVRQLDVNMNSLEGPRASKLSLTKLNVKEYEKVEVSGNLKESMAQTRQPLGRPTPEPEFKKPPLPQQPLNKYRAPIADIVQTDERVNLRNRIGKSSRTVIEDPEDLKRRAKKIREQLKEREEVYCSSDDDIVSSLRQKFDDLISARARRCIDRDSKILDEDEDGNYSFLSRCERPRKHVRRDLEEMEGTGNGNSIPSWMENKKSVNLRATDPRYHHSIGDAHKATDFVESSRYKNPQHSRRHYFDEKSEIGHQHQPSLSPNIFKSNRGYQDQRNCLYTPPGNKPSYQFVRPERALDRKLGHSHNGPIPITNRSNPSQRQEETKPRRRLHHLG